MREEAELLSGELRIPYATNLVDEVLLRKDVDLVVILCPPTHHSQIAVKALGQSFQEGGKKKEFNFNFKPEYF